MQASTEERSGLGFAGGVSGNFHEMPDEKDAPEDGKKSEPSHDVEHGGGVESAGERKIGVDGQRSTVEQNEKDGAAEPSHLGAEETNGFFAALGGEPIGFVGKINAFGRLVGENARSDECDESGGAENHEREGEESRFGLEAIGSAVGGEMRSHDIGKQRIDMRPLEKAEGQQEDEDELGKTRVAHGACL